MDSWFVSQPLRQRLHDLGFTKIIIAGKSHDTFTIDRQKQDASQWKKDLVLHEPTWGIDVPSCRVHAQSPTFGSLILFFGTSQMPIDSFNTNLWWWYDSDQSIESLRLITATHQPEATRCSLSDAQI